MDEFSKVEYQACLDLLKYYDQRQITTLQFSAGLSSAVATALLALARDTQVITTTTLSLISVVSFVTAIGLVAMLATMVQTRLYFVFPARQVNEIRAHQISLLGEAFPQNRMYLDSGFAAFKILSTQSAMIALVCLQVGVFISLAYYAMYGAIFTQSAFVGVLVTLGLFGASARYLLKNGALAADQAVHDNN